MSAYEKTSSGILIPTGYQFYVKPTEREISQKKLENYKKLAEIKQWGIKNQQNLCQCLLE